MYVMLFIGCHLVYSPDGFPHPKGGETTLQRCKRKVENIAYNCAWQQCSSLVLWPTEPVVGENPLTRHRVRATSGLPQFTFLKYQPSHREE